MTVDPNALLVVVQTSQLTAELGKSQPILVLNRVLIAPRYVRCVQLAGRLPVVVRLAELADVIERLREVGDLSPEPRPGVQRSTKSGSVGRLPRTPTAEGVRWNT